MTQEHRKTPACLQVVFVGDQHLWNKSHTTNKELVRMRLEPTARRYGAHRTGIDESFKILTSEIQYTSVVDAMGTTSSVQLSLISTKQMAG